MGKDTNSDGIADYYDADVESARDYYPFGMTQPGREFSGNTYRYGFNGKEMDYEVKGSGNSIDFGARMFDTRLGRWLSVEPLYHKYQNVSPLNFCLNAPIHVIDQNGKCVKDKN